MWLWAEQNKAGAHFSHIIGFPPLCEKTEGKDFVSVWLIFSFTGDGEWEDSREVPVQK